MNGGRRGVGTRSPAAPGDHSRPAGGRIRAEGPSSSAEPPNVDAGDPPNRRGPQARQPGLRRVLSARVPVWVLMVSLLAVAGTLGALLLVEARSTVDLAPAVGVAQRIDVRMTLCNGDVDRLKLNPRRAELDLEDVLRSEGSRMANVVVQREDCLKPRQP